MPDLMEVFDQGGWVMWPLLGVSLAAAACAIYCALTLRRNSVLSPALVAVAERLDREEDCPSALAACGREGGVFAEIIAVAVRSRSLPKAEAESMVEAAGRRAAHGLSLGATGLELSAGIAPLLGLLGTVSGMYNLLMKIAEAGVKEIGLISGGIAEALITTIAGLVIAIPALVAYSYFARRADDLILSMEEYALHLMTRLRQGLPSAAAGIEPASVVEPWP